MTSSATTTTGEWETTTVMKNKGKDSKSSAVTTTPPKTVVTDWREGIEPSQIKEVNEHVNKINTIYYNFITDTAAELNKIREAFKDDGEGNWIAWTLSDDVNLSSRAIMDLVRASNWLAIADTKGISKELLGNMAPRALSLIAGIAHRAGYAQTEVERSEAGKKLDAIEGRLKTGEKVTAEYVSEMNQAIRLALSSTSATGNAHKPLAKKKSEVVAELNELKENHVKVTQERDELMQRFAEMEAELKRLKAWEGMVMKQAGAEA